MTKDMEKVWTDSASKWANIALQGKESGVHETLISFSTAKVYESLLWSLEERKHKNRMALLNA